MKRISRLMGILIIGSVLLASCNLPRATPTIAPTLPAQTVVALTVEYLLTQSAALTPKPPATQPPTLSPTNPAPSATLPPLETATPTVASTPIMCDRGTFIDDVTVPDGTQFSPGTTFIKTWRLKNNGSCTWTSGYKLVFINGNSMEGPASVAFPASVAPQQTIDLSVTLKAPASDGTYEGFWMLENASGVRFGLGANADKQFWVKIKVGNATQPAFAVTSIGMSANPASHSGTCPVTITFTGAVTASAPGTVTYYWEQSDGARTGLKSIEFTSAGTLNVSHTWSVGSPGSSLNGWARIYVDAPNHQYFDKANFSITCSP
ncbi:MAG TPA: NBR1-Ig-like domain-containing protein [Anaerolineaceae bacterium]|nr:hypothetical protein [Longilinea sp.]HOU43917.1 NBR1-Ig-like domain-containing protein [Anaerolineaceae bacterium]HQF44979.1 NBR1-Ig-like domain-containing protein [Anaerolineaceae bacterium]HQH35096.1 NBR1-Ig-like domain-containing protein [Anaerolineaceae bacterium]HQJ03435.1 NBR1-Ig-like domain-containing protein [Anaerolineaceae bacterium]